MNILKTLRDGVHAGRGDDAPPAANAEDVGHDPKADEQPLVVGNGLPVKTKQGPGAVQRTKT